jgi:hypothetical protein
MLACRVDYPLPASERDRIASVMAGLLGGHSPRGTATTWRNPRPISSRVVVESAGSSRMPGLNSWLSAATSCPRRSRVLVRCGEAVLNQALKPVCKLARVACVCRSRPLRPRLCRNDWLGLAGSPPTHVNTHHQPISYPRAHAPAEKRTGYQSITSSDLLTDKDSPRPQRLPFKWLPLQLAEPAV